MQKLNSHLLERILDAAIERLCEQATEAELNVLRHRHAGFADTKPPLAQYHLVASRKEEAERWSKEASRLRGLLQLAVAVREDLHGWNIAQILTEAQQESERNEHPERLAKAARVEGKAP